MFLRILKYFSILFSVAFFLIILFFLFDLSSYDSSYINRNTITFSENNLNSKKSKNFFRFYENFIFNISYKFSKKTRDYWSSEDFIDRNSLPEIKIIYKKKDNFKPGKKINEIEKNFSDWPRSHGGFSSMRFSSLEILNKENVKKLKLAWIFNSNDGKKGIQANPVVYNGLVYVPTPGIHIICLDGVSGKLIWKYKVKKGFHAAKRGMLIFNDKKNNLVKLFFTNDDQLISLNAFTGEPIKNFGDKGIIKIGSSPMPPVVIDNNLVIATFRPSIEVYNINSGKLNWKYYLRDSKKDFLGGSPWGGISADVSNGIVFLATGNPRPNYSGVNRPGKNLYSNSIIAFDVRNKKKLWHFQETCHDIWNLDIPSPPILTTINKYNKRIDVVVAVTKLGNTLVLDKYSGKPIFDYKMRLAPASNLPGEKTCKYQPYLDLPEPFARNIFKESDITNLNEKSKNFVSSIVKNSNYGFFNTHEVGKDSIEYNMSGGAQWTGASVDPYKNILYVTANNIAWRVGVIPYENKSKFKYADRPGEMLKDPDGYPGVKPPWGTLSAINLNNGKILWQVPLGYYEALKKEGIITGTENFGGATATAGGLVFASGTLDKLIRGFDSDTGEELWSYKLPYIGSAPPTSYEIDGEQYIVLPSSGGTTLKINYGSMVELGDAIVAFKISE